jgi:hypothetical protein
VGIIKSVVDKSTIIVNIFLKVLTIWLIKQLGFSNQSEETRRIMILVFLIQFFNTGPLLLLINADLTELGIPILSQIVYKGFHPDFTVRWYKDVGAILIDVMISNILAPVIEFGIAFGSTIVYKFLDRKSFKKNYTTKKHSIESYI